ncbi:hypothetical protein E4U43_007134 [Claviceps pusilla]|uniref:gamma-glutamylcyclotransferase n=1 Tax=Claviceps pusilla TaxID=123648 RepID=A0A9P7NFD1_9HYPO|nr:hypothetical protein E4U43_007134 [Claviceps pusilla]
MSSQSKTSAAPAALDKLVISTRPQFKGSCAPASAIPKTTPQRLLRASGDAITSTTLSAADPVESVLYLAYGSNMCAETFLGMRGIRPLSQVNVSAPSIRLSFDLPGFPYREPCFANVAFRNVPEKKRDEGCKFVHQDMEWDGGLVGVVYEVTTQDYGRILRTEGAGSSYNETVVGCYPIGPKETQPAGGSKLFYARTLYYPSHRDDDSGRKNWWQRFLDGRQRPDPNYAQASERYLNLLRAGGQEHDLPASYRNHLDTLPAYTVTRWSQTVGQYVFILCWAPLFVLSLAAMRTLTDETGKLPSWLARAMAMLSDLMWVSYDVFFKPVFGDGERTEGDHLSDASLSLVHASTHGSFVEEAGV